MANYEAGNLQIRLSALDSGAVSSLDSVIAKLSSLSTILKSITTADMKWISSFGTRMKNLAKKMDEIDWSKTEAGFNNLTIAITPFIDKIVTADSSLRSLSEILTKVGNKKLSNLLSISGGGSGGKKTVQSGILNWGWALSKFAIAFNLARRFVRFAVDIVQAGTDYTETLNMWQVAMRDNIGLAEEFITKMNKAYGISEQTLMNAQAIFKNMVSGLGNVSDDVAYQISEAVTQMAIDYASLYNVSFESAFTKFQAALAGQVRPIRSVSGYDITQNTLQQFYESLGGTKSVRSLSQTEKRLLSIYAIFSQMGESGALGDLTKTLDNFANQSRMLSENWKTFTTWLGLSGQQFLQQHQILTKINAALIVAGTLAKAFAYNLGYVDPDFGLDWADGVEETNDALDELTGKLLDFDKFRALNNTETNALGLGIDQKLLEALAGYSSKIDEADNKAQKLADTWLENSGLVQLNADGVYELTDKARDLLDVVKALGISLGVIVGIKFVRWLFDTTTGVVNLTNATKLLNAVVLTGAVYAIIKAVEAFKEGDTWGGILATTISVALVGAWIALNWEMIKTTGIKIADFFSSIAKMIQSTAVPSIKSFTSTLTGANVAASLLAGVLGFMVGDMLLSNLGDEARSVVAPIMLVVGAVTALTLALLAMQGTLTFGTALPAIMASIGVAVAGVKAMITDYATGTGDLLKPDTGTLFRAGEAGAEVVYTASGGNTGVATVNQLKAAFYQALTEWDKTRGSDSTPIEITLDGETIYRNTTAHAKRRGEKWAH